MNSHLHNYDGIFACPFGGIGIRLCDAKLLGLDFIYENVSADSFACKDAERIAHDILKYFSDPEHVFNSQLLIKGTSFQEKVWHELQAIPVGEVRSYGDIAKKLKSSPRAVGNACRKNPIPLIVPCHRVVAKNGLGGFAGKREGKTLVVKEWLLDYEASIK